MNLKATNNVETNKYELEIEVTSEEFNQAINEVYKKRAKMNIPASAKERLRERLSKNIMGKRSF